MTSDEYPQKNINSLLVNYLLPHAVLGSPLVVDDRVGKNASLVISGAALFLRREPGGKNVG